MENPKETGQEVESKWKNIAPQFGVSTTDTVGNTENTMPASSQAKPSLGTRIAQWVSPSSLGCAVVILVIGMLITFASRDLPRVLMSNPIVGNVSPTATVEPVLPRSLVLLGTSSTGTVYYFHSPTGIYTGSAKIVTLSAFDSFYWSPRNNRIAFIVQDRSDALPLLYVFDLSNDQLTKATTRDPDSFPAEFGLKAISPIAWSQDEQYIAFVAYDRNGKAALFVSEVATGKVRRLTDGTEPVTSVAWETYRIAPGVDDERIVYVLVRDGKELTYSVKKDGADNNPWQR